MIYELSQLTSSQRLFDVLKEGLTFRDNNGDEYHAREYYQDELLTDDNPLKLIPAGLLIDFIQRMDINIWKLHLSILLRTKERYKVSLVTFRTGALANFRVDQEFYTNHFGWLQSPSLIPKGLDERIRTFLPISHTRLDLDNLL